MATVPKKKQAKPKSVDAAAPIENKAEETKAAARTPTLLDEYLRLICLSGADARGLKEDVALLEDARKHVTSLCFTAIEEEDEDDGPSKECAYVYTGTKVSYTHLPTDDGVIKYGDKIRKLKWNDRRPTDLPACCALAVKIRQTGFYMPDDGGHFTGVPMTSTDAAPAESKDAKYRWIFKDDGWRRKFTFQALLDTPKTRVALDALRVRLTKMNEDAAVARRLAEREKFACDRSGLAVACGATVTDGFHTQFHITDAVETAAMVKTRVDAADNWELPKLTEADIVKAATEWAAIKDNEELFDAIGDLFS